MAKLDSDLEPQPLECISPAAGDAGGSGRHEINTGQSEAEEAFRSLSMSADRDIDLEAKSGTSPVPGSRSENQDIGIHQSARDVRDGAPSHASIPARDQVELETQAPQAQGHTNTDPAPNDSSLDGVPNGGGSNQEPQVRMVGDFDNNANALWTLYGKEAKSHDEAHIQSLKDDMDGVLIFAGLFSASLTSFIINSVQNLQPNPAQQTAYYMQQNVAMLAQISQQISSIAPQVAIPPNPPPPFPTFKPLTSGVLVNVFWFMALVFSLSAALLAILVQQWVRDYMHVFQRYSDPLKSARLRQYLYDGSECWYMPVLAEAIPGLLHASLFLFFMGLVDFILNINTTVTVTTTIPVGICGLFYIFTTFAPVIYPQSPYQNSFSGLIWYMVQRLHGRRYKDRGSSEASKLVSSNMAKGQMQLAMEETEERKERDERAVQWLFNNLTADAEMESFAMAIPGSFDTEWGLGVWQGVFEAMGHEDNSTNGNQSVTRPPADMGASNPMPPTISTPQHVSTVRHPFGSVLRLVRVRRADNFPPVTRMSHLPPHPFNHPASVLTPVQGNNAVRELSKHVAHLLETCKNRSHFASHELWRKQTRACVETNAFLVCHANAELGWFGDSNRKVLSDIGGNENIRALWAAGLDESFVARWTCLSIMAVRVALDDESLREHSRTAVSTFANLQSQENGTLDDQALQNTMKIDDNLEEVWERLQDLQPLFQGCDWTQNIEQAVFKLHNYSSQIDELEYMNIEAGRITSLDTSISVLYNEINRATRELISQLPGVDFHDPLRELPSDSNPHISTPSTSELIGSFTTFFKPQSVFPHSQLRCLVYLCPLLAWVNDARYNEGHATILNILKALGKVDAWPSSTRRPMERQLARLQDLRDGGGLGLTVELFFLALGKQFSTSPSKGSHCTLYVTTFKTITSDWKKYKHSLGTQKLILYVVCYMVMQHSQGGVPPDARFTLPSPIVDELLVLLGNILEGQTGSHIDNAVERLTTSSHLISFEGQMFLGRVLEVISRSRAPPVSSS